MTAAMAETNGARGCGISHDDAGQQPVVRVESATWNAVDVEFSLANVETDGEQGMPRASPL